MYHYYLIYFCCLFPFLFISCTQDKEQERSTTPTAQTSHEKQGPNFVFIYADDLGYGDLGCYGNDSIATPHIDKMADNGIKFTDFYSASPVCSPSRAALLTGRYPQRMGIHKVFFPESWTGLPTDEITMAEALKDAGYSTGIVGKWHLGHHKKYLPLQNGFDEYFGIPYSNDMKSLVYMRGNKVVDFNVDQHYITRKYTKEARKFIDKHHEEPFFLYLAHTMPHVPVYASPQFQDTSKLGTTYGDVVQELDWSVGQVMDKLDEHNLTENTIVVFSSDNGPWLVMDEDAGSNGPLREGKQFTFEGGMRVPAVMQWKGTIEEGRVVREMATMMDWFPTFLHLAGAEMPDDRPIDGKNITGLIKGEAKRKDEQLLYYANGELRAYRNGKWKVKMPYEGHKETRWKAGVPAHDTLLFNLRKDIGEQNNLAKEMPAKTKSMIAKMDSMRKSLGKVPPGLEVRSPADHSFLEEDKK